MTLIKSISGIRGTIGGKEGDNLTPIDIVKFSSAFAKYIKEKSGNVKPKIVIGRDARISGEMVGMLINSSLVAMGVVVVDLGLATTPTVEMMVVKEEADGGLIITASHNPGQWNALKMLNSTGEFLTSEEGIQVLGYAESGDIEFVSVDNLGYIQKNTDALEYHINEIMNLPEVEPEIIKSANFKVVVDAVNSVGGIAIPSMLKALGVENIIELNCKPDGNFAHNPEPLKENLTDISNLIKKEGADIGVVVDPDVDRLAFVCEDGEMFGEEYTLVAVADYYLNTNRGNTVSNLSSSRALKDVTESKGGRYSASAVGEVNVVAEMKKTNATIGGEGNGGVILPALHYGRDALVGLALFLTHLAKEKCSVSELRKKYPVYEISKNKISLSPEIDVDLILEKIKEEYSSEKITDIDGVKIDFENEWVHLRKSNTEPIIRIYSEGKSKEKAELFAEKIMAKIKQIAGI